MRKRYQAVVAALPQVRVRPAAALRAALAQGYRWSDLRADLLAGVVVGIVALPLNMALAIASGVPPQYGLYTGIVAGLVIALLGGSKFQVSGPTAAFVVILAPIAAQHGLAGLAVASLMAGLILMSLGLLRMGRLIEFIPYPVTTGFTAGIAVVIATLQVKDFLGLPIGAGHAVEKMRDQYVERVRDLTTAFHERFASVPLNVGTFADVIIGVLTLGLLILIPRITRKVPAPLIALPIAALAACFGHRWSADFSPATIMSRFGTAESPSGIPSQLPRVVLPWNLPGPGGEPLAWSAEVSRAMLAAAFAIAMLGAIESLLSAVIADGMTGKKHDPDAELLAQGAGNIAAPFFGGFAATGALARTATNIRSGARSPIASIVHSMFLLASLLALAPVLGYLPMAAMAALLLIVARNMAEPKHFVFVVRFAPRSDVAVLLVCFFLTVFTDMTIAVGAGVVLASLLFMKRMAEVSTVRLVGPEHPALGHALPHGIILYDLGGPLFFGAAQRAMSTLAHVASDVRAVVLDLTDVPTIDATGMVTLDSTITRLEKRGIYVVLAGVQPQPMRALEKAGWEARPEKMVLCGSVESGLEIARAWVEGQPV